MILHLTLHRFRLIFQQYRIFAVLYIIVQWIALMISLFSCATVQTIWYTEKEVDIQSVYFEVSFLRETGEQIEQQIGYRIVDGKQEPIFENTPAYDMDAMPVYSELSAVWQQVQSELEADLLDAVSLTGLTDSSRFSASLLSAMEQIKPGEAMVSLEAFPNMRVGDSIVFQGKSLTVVKTNPAQSTPLSVNIADVSADSRCTKLRLYYQKPLTTSQVEHVKAALAAFHGVDTHTPEPVDPVRAQFNYTILLSTALIMISVLANVCYAALFRFMIDCRSFAVYRLCGASDQSILSIMLTEISGTTVLLYVLGAILFQICFVKLIHLWYPAAETLYTLRFYVLYGAAYLFLQIAMLIVPLHRFLRQDIAAAERKRG
jgi:hypothetical protein